MKGKLTHIINIFIADTARRAGFGNNCDVKPKLTFLEKKKALQERTVLLLLLKFLEEYDGAGLEVEVNDFFENTSVNEIVKQESQKVTGYTNRVYLCQNLQNCESELEYSENIEAVFLRLLPYLAR
ncbi:hypothetical protein CY0110_31705 [Crocosphaera chwakensis CCY0110]|uniref:Uncharacterized protein n=1 Tax=Crocosphaera chwakensis CCY0110 TaxID=391612 RepID=A3IWH7_9CHRO|nr:hypothetical protein CY0110_31705 [Crocosphaera chwakensis CCY0110]